MEKVFKVLESPVLQRIGKIGIGVVGVLSIVRVIRWTLNSKFYKDENGIRQLEINID